MPTGIPGKAPWGRLRIRLSARRVEARRACE